ncbi:MAG: PepSY domain-containing protein [Gemmatimonadetes bacterium]|nr:PepSY domain-containing protein [Gemmatimonadota bacterium]
MKTFTTFAAAAVLSATVAGAAQAQTGHRHETQAQLAREAHITEAQARRIALGAVPHARVKSSELEREHGHLIYSYDLQVSGRPGIEEVNVDAITGRVIAHQHEGPAAERAEARAERSERKH